MSCGTRDVTNSSSPYIPKVQNRQILLGKLILPGEKGYRTEVRVCWTRLKDIPSGWSSQLQPTFGGKFADSLLLYMYRLSVGMLMSPPPPPRRAAAPHIRLLTCGHLAAEKTFALLCVDDNVGHNKGRCINDCAFGHGP